MKYTNPYLNLLAQASHEVIAAFDRVKGGNIRQCYTRYVAADKTNKKFPVVLLAFMVALLGLPLLCAIILNSLDVIPDGARALWTSAGYVLVLWVPLFVLWILHLKKTLHNLWGYGEVLEDFKELIKVFRTEPPIPFEERPLVTLAYIRTSLTIMALDILLAEELRDFYNRPDGSRDKEHRAALERVKKAQDRLDWAIKCQVAFGLELSKAEIFKAAADAMKSNCWE